MLPAASSSWQWSFKPEPRICSGCTRQDLRSWGLEPRFQSLWSWEWGRGSRILGRAWISQGPEMLCMTVHLSHVPFDGKEHVTSSHIILPPSISSNAPLSNLCQEEISLESLGEKSGSVVSLKAGKFHHLPADNISNTATNGSKHKRNELATRLGLGAELAAHTEFDMHFSLPCSGHFLTSLDGNSKSKLCPKRSKFSGLTGLSYGPAVTLLIIHPKHLESSVHAKTRVWKSCPHSS